MLLLRSRPGLADILIAELRSLGLQGQFVERWRSVEVEGASYDQIVHCRTAEGVFLRVTPPTPCLSEEAFNAAYTAQRWPTSVDNVPLRAFSHNSRLWDVKRLERKAGWSPYGVSLCAQIVDDDLSLEIACTGRLIPRPFVYTHNFSHPVPHGPIATPIKGPAAIAPVDLWQMKPPPAVTEDTTDEISALVYDEWDFRRDLSPSYAAAVSHIAFRHLDPHESLVWDPFCGSGSIILEMLAMALGLPVADARHPFPWREWHPSEQAARRPLYKGKLRLIGSSTCAEDYRRALRHLHRFCTYYELDPVVDDDVWRIEDVEVSFHLSDFARLGPFVEGATIVTRAPRPPSMRVHAVETNLRFETFGSFLEARACNIDQCFVFSEIPANFKTATKVPWHEEAVFRDHMRRKVSILRFLGPKVKNDPNKNFDPDDV